MAFHSWFASMKNYQWMREDDGIQPLFKNVESCWNQIHWSFAKHIQLPQQYNTFLGSLDIPSIPGHLLDLLCFTSDHCYTILAALHFMGQLLTLQTAMRCGKMTCFTYKLMIEILNNTVEILKFMNKFGDWSRNMCELIWWEDCMLQNEDTKPLFVVVTFRLSSTWGEPSSMTGKEAATVSFSVWYH